MISIKDLFVNKRKFMEWKEYKRNIDTLDTIAFKQECIKTHMRCK